MYSNFLKPIRNWFWIIWLNNLTLQFLWNGLSSISPLHIYNVSALPSLCPGRLMCWAWPMRSLYKRLEGEKVLTAPSTSLRGCCLRMTASPQWRPCELLHLSLFQLLHVFLLLNSINCSLPLSVSPFLWLITPNWMFILTS